MPTTYFSSESAADIVEVEFSMLAGGTRALRLLVDSGFTGNSSFVLSNEAVDLLLAQVPPAHAMGALQGTQSRAWVRCQLPQLGFDCALIAIITDLSPLSLPANVEGMVGLTFLRQFVRWGAERAAGNAWRFFLSTGASP